MIIQYEHHGALVNVQATLQGRHKEFCLCYTCANFHPNTLDNCLIAQATYEHNVRYSITTPMWECPAYAGIAFEV